MDGGVATGQQGSVGDAWAQAALGDACYEARDYAAAIVAYSRAIDLDPGFGLAYAGRGGARTYEGELEAALADFEAALANGFATAWAYNGRGNVFRAMGDFERAFADYAHAAELDPAKADAHLNLGDLHAFAGRYEEAIAAYGRAIATNTDDVNDATAAYARRAGVLAHLGRTEEALADYEKSFVAGGAWQIAGAQRQLAAAGHYEGAIGGVYDRATARALKACLGDPACRGAPR